MTLPIARTAPLCFSHVDGSRGRAGMASSPRGGAKMGVGDGAASCELKAPFASLLTCAFSSKERQTHDPGT